MFQYRKGAGGRKTLSDAQRRIIRDDITEALSTNAANFFKLNENLDINPRNAILEGEINHVWVITWFRMRGKRDNQAQQKETVSCFLHYSTFHLTLSSSRRKGQVLVILLILAAYLDRIT